jgi:hypothetical protein
MTVLAQLLDKSSLEKLTIKKLSKKTQSKVRSVPSIWISSVADGITYLTQRETTALFTKKPQINSDKKKWRRRDAPRTFDWGLIKKIAKMGGLFLILLDFMLGPDPNTGFSLYQKDKSKIEVVNS